MVAARVRHFDDGPVPGKPGILIVDDEDAIRSLLGVVLRRQGFDVWLAAGGAEALEVYAQHQRDIGLVLLDVRMPGLDGPQTLASLRRLRPGLRGCFMSGHTGEYTDKELLGHGVEQVFAKPFRLNDLVDCLAQHASRMERRSA